MRDYTIIPIRQRPDLLEDTAEWFHEKWRIPVEAYRESMEECLKNQCPVPQWYVAVENRNLKACPACREQEAMGVTEEAERASDRIIGGLGIIANDFHERKDLTPNVCAVYVEEEFRCRGIAGELLNFVCRDMKEKNINTLYLLTDHTLFYERYGWEFLCMVQGEGETELSRMYVHKLT